MTVLLILILSDLIGGVLSRFSDPLIFSGSPGKYEALKLIHEESKRESTESGIVLLKLSPGHPLERLSSVDPLIL